MAFFNSKKERISNALIDIDSASVGAALAHTVKGESPMLYYTVRHFIEVQEHENPTEAMLRTLAEVTNLLVSKGSPILRQETGSGHLDHLFVSIGAPWQKTTIRTESIVEVKPFVFTKALLSEITKASIEIPDGYVKSGESVIATLLNGYETSNPFGKKVTRADMVILSSLLDKNIAQKVEDLLRKTYHTHALTITGFASVTYAAFKDIYPHEKDFIVLEVSGEATDITFIKHGMLVDVVTIFHGVNDLIRSARTSEQAQLSTQIETTEKTWLANIQSALQDASTRHALPHTLFLLADAEARDYLQRLLDSSSMRSLWLSEDPLRVLSVVPGHFAQAVKVRGEAEGDVSLSLLALFSKKGIY